MFDCVYFIIKKMILFSFQNRKIAGDSFYIKLHKPINNMLRDSAPILLGQSI